MLYIVYFLSFLVHNILVIPHWMEVLYYKEDLPYLFFTISQNKSLYNMANIKKYWVLFMNTEQYYLRTILLRYYSIKQRWGCTWQLYVKKDTLKIIWKCWNSEKFCYKIFQRLTLDLFAGSLYCDHFPVSSPPGHLRTVIRANNFSKTTLDLQGCGFYSWKLLAHFWAGDTWRISPQTLCTFYM